MQKKLLVQAPAKEQWMKHEHCRTLHMQATGTQKTTRRSIAQGALQKQNTHKQIRMMNMTANVEYWQTSASHTCPAGVGDGKDVGAGAGVAEDT